MSNLEIIHENNDYIVVNKAAGRISEKSPYENDTVEDQVFNYFLKKKLTLSVASVLYAPSEGWLSG